MGDSLLQPLLSHLLIITYSSLSSELPCHSRSSPPTRTRTVHYLQYCSKRQAYGKEEHHIFQGQHHEKGQLHKRQPILSQYLLISSQFWRISLLQYYKFRQQQKKVQSKMNMSISIQSEVKAMFNVNINYFYFIKIIQYKMQERAKRRNYEDLTELSPWPDDQKSNFQTLQLGQKPRIKKMKSIPPRIKSISERKVIQRNSIKLTDYELPPVNRKSSRVKQQYSMTIQPPQGRLIRNISSHRLKSSESMGFIPEEDRKKFKLSGKKYDMVPVERSERMDDKDSRPYFNNNTMLLFSKKKDQILKRVLDQIQGRIKELRVYQ